MAAVDEEPFIGADEVVAQADVQIGPDVSAADAAANEEAMEGSIKETREDMLARHRYVHTLPKLRTSLCLACAVFAHSTIANLQT